MVFHFPDDDTLRFALTGGLVPPAVGLAPARAGRDADGRPWVEPAGAVPRALSAALRRVGVRVEQQPPTDGGGVAHWLQVLPLRRDPAPPALTDQTPVLFELPDPSGRPGRLGRRPARRQADRAAAPRPRRGQRAGRVVGARRRPRRTDRRAGARRRQPAAGPAVVRGRRSGGATRGGATGAAGQE